MCTFTFWNCTFWLPISFERAIYLYFQFFQSIYVRSVELMKILHFQVKLTSRYHTSRPGVLGVKVVDVVGQLCTELSVIDGEVSKVMLMVMI